jgi:hypothetical protein
MKQSSGSFLRERGLAFLLSAHGVYLSANGIKQSRGVPLQSGTKSTLGEVIYLRGSSN